MVRVLQHSALLSAPLFFDSCFFICSYGSHHCQVCVRQHRQGDMPIPARQIPYFIMIQSYFTFRRLKTFLNCPTRPGRSRHLFKRCLLRPAHNVISYLFRIADTAPCQQPPLPAPIDAPQHYMRPLIDAFTFTARTATLSLPNLLRQLRNNIASPLAPLSDEDAIL